MVDEKDKKILDVLRENARASCSEISKQTGISTRTVYDRIKNLEKNQIIVQYITRVDFFKVGIGVLAYVLAQADYGYLKGVNMTQSELANKIAKTFSNISDVSTITGDFDLIMKIRVKDIPTLNKFAETLRVLPGILRMKTLIVLHDVKQAIIKGDLAKK